MTGRAGRVIASLLGCAALGALTASCGGGQPSASGTPPHSTSSSSSTTVSSTSTPGATSTATGTSTTPTSTTTATYQALNAALATASIPTSSIKDGDSAQEFQVHLSSSGSVQFGLACENNSQGVEFRIKATGQTYATLATCDGSISTAPLNLKKGGYTVHVTDTSGGLWAFGFASGT